jgi:hypothetical protein
MIRIMLQSALRPPVRSTWKTPEQGMYEQGVRGMLVVEKLLGSSSILEMADGLLARSAPWRPVKGRIAEEKVMTPVLCSGKAGVFRYLCTTKITRDTWSQLIGTI